MIYIQSIMHQENYKQRKSVIHYIERTNQLSFKTSFQNVDKQTGGKWLIYGSKRRKDNQVQSMELPCIISYKTVGWECEYPIVVVF